jgi:branched-chain amino acid transport system ATP-binding protein
MSAPAEPAESHDAALSTSLPMLRVDSVCVRFGGLVALDDISFDVGSQEIVGLIGPNGAGKTTAFNVICGFIRSDSGTVSFPSTKHTRRRSHELHEALVARTLQGVGLFPHLTVLENVMAGAQSRPGGGFVASLVGFPTVPRTERRVRQEAMELLVDFGIESVARKLPASIPYGISKKVSVARALMSHPRLLLLDEPASGLDDSELTEFADRIRSWRDTMSVLLVEHNMDFVMPLVDRLVVLNFGRVIASGPPEEIRENPDVLAAYLGTDA